MSSSGNLTEVEVKNDTGNPLPVKSADGDQVTLGAKADAEVAGAGSASVVAVLKRLRTLLNGGLPSGLGANGGLLVEGIAAGVGVPVDTELPAAAALSDALANPTAPQVGSSLLVWDGSQWVRRRTPNTFKTTSATSAASGGNTAIWTPTTGKKFRLMGYLIGIAGNSSFASAGNSNISLTDGAGGTTIATETFWVPSAAGTVLGGFYLPAVNIENGYLSSAANNVLYVHLDTTFANGQVRVNVWGTEE
jgi:hypothetical protein